MILDKRLLILDIETTGLKVGDGHRMTEIACIEMINGSLTGKQYHQYIDPERDLDEGAQKITGLTWSFLKQYPNFSQVVEDFLDFVGNGHLIIHNAPFDMSFINYQLTMHGYEKIAKERIIDTLPMARSQFPGRGNSLDALCERFAINLDKRNYHGALIDVQLLARVYIELTGGVQRKLQLVFNNDEEANNPSKEAPIVFPKRVFPFNNLEESHKEFLSEHLANHRWR